MEKRCSPSLWVFFRVALCASLNHHKKTKADGSRLIHRSNTETLVLLSVYKYIDVIERKAILDMRKAFPDGGGKFQ